MPPAIQVHLGRPQADSGHRVATHWQLKLKWPRPLAPGPGRRARALEAHGGLRLSLRPGCCVALSMEPEGVTRPEARAHPPPRRLLVVLAAACEDGMRIEKSLIQKAELPLFLEFRSKRRSSLRGHCG
jgi:hypothetical protein